MGGCPRGIRVSTARTRTRRLATTAVALGATVATTLGFIALGAVGVPAQAGVAQAPSAMTGDVPLYLEALTPSTISGTGAIGDRLTLTAPTWNRDLVVTTVQWYADGQPIAGATRPRFRPTSAQAGTAVQSVVTGALPGLVPVDSASNVIVVPGASTPALSGTAPTIVGQRYVGALLYADGPDWNLPGVATAYQWRRDGAPISGATSQVYVPQLADAGHQLSVLTTGHIDGLPDIGIPSDPITIPGLPPLPFDPPQATQDPSVSGDNHVGSTLTLQKPTWDRDNVIETYQWMRDNSPIAGATGTTYDLVPDDLGHQINVQVTGRDLLTANTVASDTVYVYPGPAPVLVTPPSVAGRPAVNDKLTVTDNGEWDGHGGSLTYSYLWYRNANAQYNDTSANYFVYLDDLGYKLSVQVTAARPGYEPARWVSEKYVVEKLPSNTELRLKKDSVAQGSEIPVVVLLTADQQTPGGDVVFTADGEKYVTMHARGTKKVYLPPLPRGTHTIVGTFQGSRRLAPSESNPITVTVR